MNCARCSGAPVSYRFFAVFFRERGREGTLAPFSRASLRPMAIACLRLFTAPPEPLFNVPFLRRCIADSTLFDADDPYLAISSSAFFLTQSACRASHEDESIAARVVAKRLRAR
jgi:hypothetical protein